MDPLVDQSGQAYAFTNDNPLNATDPQGLITAALMGGGYETPQQEANTLNKLFDQQAIEGDAIGGGISAQVVNADGKQYLVAFISPISGCVPGQPLTGILLPTSVKNVEPTMGGGTASGSFTLSPSGAILVSTVVGAGRALFAAGRFIYQGITGEGLIDGTVADFTTFAEVVDALAPFLLFA